MTRIIAGRLGGRRLRVPDEGTRPTSDRVREAVFNMLDARLDLDGLRVVDLYAGSGALGLEALSRGAASATFVDSARRATAAIAANVTACGVASTTSVLTRPVSAYLATRPGPFDVVFADPPYAMAVGAIDEDLRLLADGVLADDGLLVLERSSRAAEPNWPAQLEVVVRKNYGDTTVEVARHVD